ncbi:MAG: hypothetical protein NU470_00285 [Candidatus Carsonella ruddii]|nr:hypothetical protein [Candidatus Carsonella ruddii]WGS66720.1 hypothetical protein MEJ66_00290 [Candidatus Carsonella ruddii]WMC18315.1 MAG: hypothetical protein NU472_00285 [Candidatus Carsonella ruddii]WMC18509.1 MAG: hypothetical protein NU470_00285 [Candidatus Carsonella ruddii]WMC20108.1 MAG: hypothetical protein NVS90_00290 [Candidatus Carsonella ruddii]
MKIIKNFIYFKNLNNNSKIINFNNFFLKSIKKIFLNKYDIKEYIFNINKIKINNKKKKKIKKNELFV